MTEYRDFMVFEINEPGDLKELNVKKEDLGDFLHPENVYTIINQEIKRIYLWKGAISPVRKRFIASRIATKLQGDMMKAGYKRCKVVSIDQGEELEEFLNVFGLESMEIKVEMEEKRYIRNIEKEQSRITSILSTKVESNSKLSEIQNCLSEDEQIIWNKSSIVSLDKNWLKNLLKNKNYKIRLKKISEANKLEIKNYKNTYAVTNKSIISHSIFNKFFDFSNIPTYAIKIKGEGEMVILELNELNSFEIEQFGDEYDVWFNAEPIGKGGYIFAYERLTFEEYSSLINALDNNFIAEIPQKIKKLNYIHKS